MELTARNYYEMLKTLVDLDAQLHGLKTVLVEKGVFTNDDLLEASAVAYARVDPARLALLELLRGIAEGGGG